VVTGLPYYYLEITGDVLHVYATANPTATPCHVEGAEMFKFNPYFSMPWRDGIERLGGRMRLIQNGWHDLYEVDSCAVKVLQALLWFQTNNHKKWMPRNAGYSSPDAIKKIVELKDAFDLAEAADRTFKPQKEWGVFSKTLAATIRDEFIKARLGGKDVDASAFYQKACDRFRRGLKLAPWLKPLYDSGCCRRNGVIFLAIEYEVAKLGSEALELTEVDGTTGSVRAAIRKLSNADTCTQRIPLRDFPAFYPDVLERLKRSEPKIYSEIAVKVLFE
jgi:hypothetical protein